MVLETAYKKRLELKKLFQAETANINPLVLVQIPTAEAGEDKIKAVKKFLADKGITERKDGAGNGKLAIWLAEQKSETLDWVSEPDNEIEFLIFKQAIDTGWDCPRAHILVKRGNRVAKPLKSKLSGEFCVCRSKSITRMRT